MGKNTCIFTNGLKFWYPWFCQRNTTSYFSTPVISTALLLSPFLVWFAAIIRSANERSAFSSNHMCSTWSPPLSAIISLNSQPHNATQNTRLYPIQSSSLQIQLGLLDHSHSDGLFIYRVSPWLLMEHLSMVHPVQHLCLHRMSDPSQMRTGLKTGLSHILEPFFNRIILFTVHKCVFLILWLKWWANLWLVLSYFTPAVARKGPSGANAAVTHTQPHLTLSLANNPLISTTRDDYLLITPTSFSVIALQAD